MVCLDVIIIISGRYKDENEEEGTFQAVIHSHVAFHFDVLKKN